jgi:hypothetical protein
MKKLFEDRVRIAVYLERGSLDAMTALARSEGKTLVEWARDVLLAEVSDMPPSKIKGKLSPSGAVFTVAPKPDHEYIAEGMMNAHRHTAESNWRTCLCEACSKKRKALE